MKWGFPKTRPPYPQYSTIIFTMPVLFDFRAFGGEKPQAVKTGVQQVGVIDG